MRVSLLIASLACSWLAAAHAGERTYRWTDEKGRVHYSDVKSAPKSEQVQIKQGAGIKAQPEDESRRIAARQAECQRRKEQLALYTGSAEITETDSLGRVRSYSVEERQQLLDRTKQAMQEACNGVSPEVVLTNNDEAENN